MTASIDWIHSRLKFGSRPGLERIEYLLKRLGNPEKELQMVHVAGTNGKGSTAVFLREILVAYGLKVGTFTSPYIESFNERIAINGQFISNSKLDNIVEKVRQIVEAMDQDERLAGITEFEILTAIGFYYFKEEAVDLAIIEVGLGGLFDSTNVITPVASIITTIGLDHQDILGQSIEAIAFQKAGIIKTRRPVVLGRISEAAKTVIKAVAQEKESPVIELQTDYRFEIKAKQELSYFGSKIKADFKISLSGKYQLDNAAVALATFEILAAKLSLLIDNQLIQQGLINAHWPARMEKIGDFILDGAHNPHAINRLVDEFMNDKRTVHILFSAIQTKDYQQMIQQLLTIPNVDLAVTTFAYPNAIELTDIELPMGVGIVQAWQDYIKQPRKSEDLYLITGSLYFLSQVRAVLLEY
ncbi:MULTISPECIES: folylpolyglutamate synthase/dihydrofolate synthase family protein [unclassified Enterococcus]|uniref:bifunctional folylpolyglutamate synthase/dihydrofolate synthase n=1 Tax=unclassified Enterococcus TaxID=2608891 RepID=UPI00155790B9|nr:MULTISPECIES: folylpolyglutamate synthase/dihydrofolate synthase family protein [unclassified Enterococcus]MBS7577304.1 bifunctional folylpolyglutamate synthase/dihydrofolate synthase [Enterococcus sp. MMGLQ5-2]MBS7584603.1 bifunctional folylpolyglutamate synthase/dihydrofolate synthase [Enterococcus sp. MMGLQ5-1]NPD12458.1 bifunctional folylpolyglutamate synthase/dihydrofolate synthase [Enterococcus sp. MMGLQ5-1]NPD37138.1 bifunctional folylpolyglutamate synthase/dihydrofolate synthase [Ent